MNRISITENGTLYAIDTYVDQCLGEHESVWRNRADLEGLKRELKGALDLVNKEIAVIDEQILDEIGESGVSSATVSGFNVHTRTDKTVRMTNRDLVINYMERYNPSMLTVNANTLRAWVKERIEEDGFIPPEISGGIETGERISIVCTQKKG